MPGTYTDKTKETFIILSGHYKVYTVPVRIVLCQ